MNTRIPLVRLAIIFTIYLGSIFSTAINAAPVDSSMKTFTQPSGYSFQGQAQGDEVLSWYVSTDNQIFLLNRESGAYEYAEIAIIDGATKLIPSGILVGDNPSPVEFPEISAADLQAAVVDAENLFYGVSKDDVMKMSFAAPATDATSEAATSIADEHEIYPGVKDYKTVVIVVEFSDYGVSSDDQVWHDKIFPTTGDTVNEYFAEASQGKVTFSPVEESYGTANDGVIRIQLDSPRPDWVNLDNRAAEAKPLLKEALELTDPYIDYSQLDNQPLNNQVSQWELQVIFVVSGPGGGYAWSFYEDGLIPIADGLEIGKSANNGSYFVASAADGVNENYKDPNTRLFCHELGHSAFDLPDLYKAPSIRGWGLMGSGDFVHYSGYSKITARLSETHTGFVKPEVILPTKVATTVDLTHFDSPTGEYTIAKVPTSASKFFVLEQRRAIGHDIKLQDSAQGVQGMAAGDHGVLISDTGHPIVKAGGLSFTDPANITDMFYPGNNTLLTPYTTPNSDAYHINQEKYFQSGVRVKVGAENSTDESYPVEISIGIDDSVYCEEHQATNDTHVNQNRAYKETVWFSSTYYAVGSGESLGNYGFTQTTLKESPEGYFSIGECESVEPTNAPTLSNLYANVYDTYINFSGRTSDIEDDVVRVDLRIDNSDWIAAEANYYEENGIWSSFWKTLQTEGLSAGNHTVSFRAIDNAGNMSTVESLSFTIGEVEPTPPEITSASANSTSTTLTVNGTASDINDNLQSVTLVFDSNQVECNGTTTFSCQIDVSSYAAGNYSGYLIATDTTALTSDNYPISFTIPEPDLVPPGIVLIGESVITITVGDTYIEPGYIATDDKDGDITDRVVVTGSVNTNVAGAYILRYNVSDLAGNAANEVTRTVVVDLPACTEYTDTLANHVAAGRMYTETSGGWWWMPGTTTYYTVGAGIGYGTDGSRVITIIEDPENPGQYIEGECPDEPQPPVIETFNVSIVGEEVTVTGTASDPDNDIISVMIYVNGGGFECEGTTNWTCPVQTFAPGTHSVAVKAVDSRLVDSQMETITFEILEPTAPVINVSSTSVSLGALNVRATITDVNNDLREVILGFPERGVQCGNSGTIDCDFDVSELEPGDYVAQLIAVDNANNITVENIAFTISQGTAPVITDVQHDVTNQQMIVTANITDAENDIIYVRLEYADQIGQLDCENTSGSTYTCDLTYHQVGTYNFMVTAGDNQGNRTLSDSFEVTFVEAPTCFTSTNSEHIDGGRAYMLYNILVYAQGSGTYLGLPTATSSLEETSEGVWTVVTSCPE